MGKPKDELILLSKVLTAFVSICVCVWFFGRAPFNEQVNELMDDYISSDHYKVNHKKLTKEFVNSADFKVFVDKVITDYEKSLAVKSSNRISLRKLLAAKMGVDEDEVHIELGRQYKGEKIHLESSKEVRDRIIEEIKRHHRDSNINNN